MTSETADMFPRAGGFDVVPVEGGFTLIASRQRDPEGIAEMTYLFVQLINGQWHRQTFEPDTLIAGMSARGFEVTGRNTNPRQREELQGQPKFSGVNGPMYDGPGRVRYETPDAYRALSE